MATQYGSWGSVHTNTGNYRLYMTYDYAETADSYTIWPIEIGVQAYSKTYDIMEISGSWSIIINGTTYFSDISGAPLPTHHKGTTVSLPIWNFPPDGSGGVAKNFSKTHSDQTATIKIQGSNVSIKCWWFPSSGGEKQTTVTGRTPNTTAYIPIKAKTTYTISFNTQGGSGSFGDLTKWHGEPLTIHSGTPTKTNYTFVNWKIRNTSTTVDPGKQIAAGSNGNYVLDAQWKIITYPVTFDANGGTGAPGNTTKNSGSALTFSSAKPTKKDASSGKEYDFLGWAETSAPNTIVYPVGNTTIAANVNRPVNLIAVWREHYYSPTIANTKIFRCNKNGKASDEGKYAYVSFDWAIDNWKYPTNTASEVSITVGETTVTIPEAVDRLSGSVAIKIGSDPDVLFDVDTEYPVTISVADKQASTETLYKTTVTGRLNVAEYPLDFGSAVNSIGVFKPASDEAEYEKVIDIGGDVKIDGDLFVRGFKLIDLFYPIGSYYETSNSSFDPNTTWGGTWVLESGGNFHIAAGNGYPVGTTGGEATHTLTTDEIPAHSHTVAVAYPFTAGGAKPFVPYASNTTEYGSGYSNVVKTSGGSGHAHNNIPPYVAVNRWHRTA